LCQLANLVQIPLIYWIYQICLRHNSLPKWPYVLCMVGLSFGYALLHLFFCWRVCALWGDL
jgi:hypothetical protein